MVKICQTGLLKLNFETTPKKTHFPVFAKNFRRPWMKLNIFFANFQIVGPLGCQGWVVIPQNVKKSQNHCTLVPLGAQINIGYLTPYLTYGPSPSQWATSCFAQLFYSFLKGESHELFKRALLKEQLFKHFLSSF
jgi:hypothetical protein